MIPCGSALRLGNAAILRQYGDWGKMDTKIHNPVTRGAALCESESSRAAATARA